MEDDERTASRMGSIKLGEALRPNGAEYSKVSTETSPTDSKVASPQPGLSPPEDAKPSNESGSTPDTERPAKPSRKPSQKAKREPVLFDLLPDVTEAACECFQLIPDCLYGSKHMGSTDSDALDCDCKEDWHGGFNHACSEDGDCINRVTKVECVVGGSGSCGDGCQNQRFQRKEYANVSVIKTDKKGFGLRANSDLQANDFIFEYIGEVINEPTFRRRMIQYDDEGIKHFYFMSLTKGEFVDATKKGNLGRFCNHSCNPNCYVDKWVVGDKLRMGIFALKAVRAGEELVFNYNVDRYGADPQPCYCGEPNCVGFIGGKTQTERSTKLPLTMVEALGIDDDDAWETAALKKPRKKKPDEDDEEYVNSVQARTLDEDGARKVMAALMQCKEKWIAVKLLERIQKCDDERVLHVVVRMHAYQILKTTINTFILDDNVVLQVLDVLDRFPRLTRNKIVDSNIDSTIKGLTTSHNEEIAGESTKLIDDWNKLDLAFRIKRRKVDPSTQSNAHIFDERRVPGRDWRDEVASTSKPSSPLPDKIDAPRGPRNHVAQRNTQFYNTPRPPRPQPYHANLPDGWYSARDKSGNIYYYNRHGITTWQRPTQPAAEPGPKAPPKALRDQQIYQSIIDEVTKEHTPKPSATQTPQQPETPVKDTKKDKWRSLPIEKQMKIYENTLFPHVKYVLDKFRHKLPKDDLKKFGKEVNKKLVASDYKHNRVSDPTAPLTAKQERNIKSYVKEFLEKAVAKYKERESRRATRQAHQPTNGNEELIGADPGSSAAQTPQGTPPGMDDTAMPEALDDPDDVDMSDGEDDVSMLKRKRDEETLETPSLTPSDGPSIKKVKETASDEPSPPPPPPPPPDAAMESEMSEEQKALREQEEALMRENEEAQRLEDEAARDKAHLGLEAPGHESLPQATNGSILINGSGE